MTGRGRGFLLKKIEDENAADEQSDVGSSISTFPILGRGGRGMKLPTQSLSTPQQTTTDTTSDSDSNVSAFPLVGRGRGILSTLGRGTTSSEPKSSESDPIEQAKQFATGQFDDLSSPKKISSSSGRGRSSGLITDEKESAKSLIEGLQKVTIEAPKQPSPEKVEPIPSIEKEPEEVVDESVVLKHGSKGTPFTALTNCIMLKCDKDFGVFEYEVRFLPEIDNIQHRYKYLGQLREQIGSVKTFDGVTLYLPKQLPDHTTSYTAAIEGQNEVEVKIIYRRKKRLGECIHLYNVLFERIMRDLKYQRVGRKCFDPSSPKEIKQHKLEVWPGYVKSVEEQEGGIMLLLDVSHRVLSQKTCLEYMSECAEKFRQNYQDMVKKALIGHVVLTRYNNKTYRIDDIDFTKNPTAKFMKGDTEIDYCAYYKQHYNKIIKDMKQPLLIHREDVRVPGQTAKKEMVFCLIPELCYVTGLTDEMRSQFTIMKDLAVYTKLAPFQRVAAYKQYVDNINKHPEAKQKLTDWGLTLDSDPCQVTARVLNKEVVIFGQNKSFDIAPNADFSRNATSCEVLEPVNLQNWILIYTKNDSKTAESFENILMKVCGPTGIRCAPPRRNELPNDRTDTYVNKIKDCLKDKNIQIVVTIFPTLRDDRYSAVKTTLCKDNPCPSQCINSKTLRNEAKSRSIIQKILLQMNCKLGGTLWGIKIPLKNTMIVGIDTYHEANQKGNAVGGFVASMNSSFTKYNSIPTIQKKKEELLNGLIASMERTLRNYKQINSTLPDRIIIYRDGVGDGQLQHVETYEIPQFKEACERMCPGYSPKITFIVVQKRINHKFFKFIRDKPPAESYVNPPPGSVLDHTVTRRNAYDFFLCSQHVREGTVTPSHFIVLRDDNQFEPDIVQQLTYKLTYLYYNWPGAVRVPAPCQYAHKLAYLVGLAIKGKVDDSLTDKLFYL
jgi:aubergine-like protein